jgi:hypothetical protein
MKSPDGMTFALFFTTSTDAGERRSRSKFSALMFDLPTKCIQKMDFISRNFQNQKNGQILVRLDAAWRGV